MEENGTKRFEGSAELDVAELSVDLLDAPELAVFFVDHLLNFLKRQAPRFQTFQRQEKSQILRPSIQSLE